MSGDGEASSIVAVGQSDLASQSISRNVAAGNVADVKARAQCWCELLRRDLHVAALESLNAILELAGLPGNMVPADFDNYPGEFLGRMLESMEDEGLQLESYPLAPAHRHARRSTNNFDRFWFLALQGLHASILLESGIVALLLPWLQAFLETALRPLRHAATVASLAVAEAMIDHKKILTHTHDGLERQVNAIIGGASQPPASRHAEHLRRELQAVAVRLSEVQNASDQLLDAIVQPRSHDVSEVIRMLVLTKLERLLQQHLQMFVQHKWTAPVFLMTRDPSADVRLKAIKVAHRWYATVKSMPAAAQDHLRQFAQRALHLLVERAADVDPRVAVAALRCLRLPALVDHLEDKEFNSIVCLCIGSLDLAVRRESALFVNSHVFQEPGICRDVQASLQGRRRKRREDGSAAADSIGGEPEDPAMMDRVLVSTTCLLTLIEFLENYAAENLWVTDRVVSAFWGMAPALTHWGTMMSLCLVGESSTADCASGASELLQPKQRLVLLYIMDAAVSRVHADSKSADDGDREAAMTKLYDACAQVLPQMSNLFSVGQSDATQIVLLSHVFKILIEHAVEHSQKEIIEHSMDACCTLRRIIESQAPPDAVKHCVDALLALGLCSDGATSAFLDIAKAVHASFDDALCKDAWAIPQEEAEFMATFDRLLLLFHRGFDMTFGHTQLVHKIIILLQRRKNASTGSAASSAVPRTIPPPRLTLDLIEASLLTVLWYIQIAQNPEADDSNTILPELPSIVSHLRTECAELLVADRNPYVRFQAFSCYMCLAQLALGVSDRMCLELSVDNQPLQASGWACTFPVQIPTAHMNALLHYLNNLFDRLSGTLVEEVPFDADVYHCEAPLLHQAPPQHGMTSVDFLWHDFRKESQKENGDCQAIDPERELFLTVVSSRMVLESELESIYAGPLGWMLLTQCERGRPKPLQEVALRLFRRLRELARSAELFAAEYYRMQRNAVDTVFETKSLAAAASLASTFIYYGGPLVASWLEKAFCDFFDAAVLSCITPDGGRLPLLVVYASWPKRGQLPAFRCSALASELQARCAASRIDGRSDARTAGLFSRLESLARGPPEPPP